MLHLSVVSSIPFISLLVSVCLFVRLSVCLSVCGNRIAKMYKNKPVVYVKAACPCHDVTFRKCFKYLSQILEITILHSSAGSTDLCVMNSRCVLSVSSLQTSYSCLFGTKCRPHKRIKSALNYTALLNKQGEFKWKEKMVHKLEAAVLDVTAFMCTIRTLGCIVIAENKYCLQALN